MKKLKISIIITILLFISVSIILYLYYSKAKVNTDYDEEEYDQYHHQIETDKQVKLITNANTYFTIKNLTKNYYTTINNLNYKADDINKSVLTQDEIDQIIYEKKEESKKILCAIMDTNYQKENGIDESNIINKISNIGEYGEIDVSKIYMSEQSTKINMFFIWAIDQTNNKEHKIIIITDSFNSAYIVVPEEWVKNYNFDNIEIGKNIDCNISEIEANDYNTYKYTSISKEQLSKEYLNNYKTIIKTNIKEAYNLLDTEYRQKRFGTFNNFQEYINNNQNEIESMVVSEYIINNNGENREIICKNRYGNTFVFEETAIMEYTVKLDTYTLETDKFKETYNNSDDLNKVMLNCDKFIKMINARDYRAAYLLLEETYRKNNFGSESNFEQYMRKYYPLHYRAAYENISDQGGTYIQNIKLTAIESTSITNNIKIIMRLEEGTDYVMSFEIK